MNLGNLVGYLVTIVVELVVHELYGFELDALLVPIESSGSQANDLEMRGFGVLVVILQGIKHEHI